MRPSGIGLRAMMVAGFLGLASTIQLAMAAEPTNACALLSQTQVATALGVEVDAGKNIIGANDCRWIQRGAAPGSDSALLQVNLTKAQAFEIGKTPLSGWNKASISGIGDDAYSADRGKITFPISPSLSVRKGSVFIVIVAKVPSASMEQTKAVEKQIASAALEKL